MTTFQEKTGNLLESGADCLVNATNTRGVMGAGIALQFARRWPEMLADYRRDAEDGMLWTDQVHTWFNRASLESAVGYEPRWIVNLHTKDDPAEPSRYLYVVRGLIDLVEELNDELADVTTVAVPALGCGLGGLNWPTVNMLIRDVLSEVHGELEVWIYPPQPVAEVETGYDPGSVCTCVPTALDPLCPWHGSVG